LPEIKAVKLEIPGGSTFNSSKSSMLAFDPSGRFLAGWMTTKELTTRSVVWDAESGQILTPPDGWSINIGSHDSFGDANVLFKAGVEQGFGWGTSLYAFETDRVVRAEGREIVVRDASTLRVERRFGLFASNVDGLSLNADRTQIAGQAGDEIRVWNFATGLELPPPKGIEPFAGRAFGSNGERLVISGEQEFLQMKRQTSPTESLTAGSMVRFRYGNGRNFDRQMRWCVIKDAGGWPATLLDLESGKEKVIGAKNTHLMSCAFFPDGKRLATGDADGSVRIWDTETWPAVLTLRAHERGVTNLAVSPDGRRMATVGWDAKLKIWDGTPDAIND
jgi:WD40 repeat protein